MLQRAFLVPVRLYRRIFSPTKKPSCKYLPTCSEYCELAILKHGALKGSFKSIYRILRCNPFTYGGYDPP